MISMCLKPVFSCVVERGGREKRTTMWKTPLRLVSAFSSPSWSVKQMFIRCEGDISTMVTKEELVNLSKMCRLSVPEGAEMQRAQSDLQNIRSALCTIQTAPTKGVEPLVSPVRHHLVLREDTPGVWIFLSIFLPVFLNGRSVSISSHTLAERRLWISQR